jgi:hypothetical protein
MYDFAVVALLALAVVKLVDFLADSIDVLDRMRSVLTFVFAIAAVVALDYSMFQGFGIGIRDEDLGTWMTGFVVAGMTVPWRAAFAWLTHDRAESDETLGGHTGLRKAA